MGLPRGADLRSQLQDRLDAIAVVAPIPPRQRWDWMFTALLALAALVPITADDFLPLWARVIPAAVAVGCIPFRRHRPLLALTVVSITNAVCLSIALGGPEVVDGWLAPAGLAFVVLIYALCRWATPLHVLIGFIASVGSEVVIEWAAGDPQAGNWALVLGWLAIAGFALAMRYRARVAASRLDQVRLAERNSLARELHDTVAHHVTAIAVQAQAGQYVVDSNPAAAAEALRSIESIANASIDEMRRMVGILRSDHDHTRTVAPDTLDVLTRDEGLPTVHLRGDTKLDELPAGVGAALFRIAQESITNARRHSRGVTFVEIAVERRDDRVQMTIDNDGTPTTRNSGSGYGEVGMRERVEALGGTFDSSARPSIGWRTSTSIPVARVDR